MRSVNTQIKALVGTQYLRSLTINDYHKLLDAIKNGDTSNIRFLFLGLQDHISATAISAVLVNAGMYNLAIDELKLVLQEMKEHEISTDTYLFTFDFYATHHNTEALALLYEQNKELIHSDKNTRFQCATMNCSLVSVKWILENLNIEKQFIKEADSNIGNLPESFQIINRRFLAKDPSLPNGQPCSPEQQEVLREYLRIHSRMRMLPC